jgi:hypothetical protein
MESPIVGIHGVWNYGYFKRSNQVVAAASAAMAADWSTWLAGSTDGGSSSISKIAYYSNLLHRGTPQGGDSVDGLDQEEQEVFLDLMNELLPVGAVAQGSRTARVRQCADWFTSRFGSTACATAAVFCREVNTYFTRSVRRNEVRRHVAATIASLDSPIVIAHSLGSVVAYEALWSFPEVKVDFLLTIGSPLAMTNVVFEKVLNDTPIRVGAAPPGVRRWVNIHDVGDIVALPPSGISGKYPGVTREFSTTIDEWDFHTAKSYLRSAAVRDVLRGGRE